MVAPSWSMLYPFSYNVCSHTCQLYGTFRLQRQQSKSNITRCRDGTHKEST